ncbi:MAG: Flp pilus assembly protein CpaB [Bryobacteraceae bacterium]|nr:Flp pilus assembly protein CpaB [Bryobacteraceae bacterium]
MNKRFMAVVAFALVVALGASFLVYRQLEKGIRSAGSGRAAKVLVAARDLPIGTLLKSDDLKMVEWTGTPPAYAIVKAQDAVGHGVIANIYSGEPINPMRLAATGAGGGLAATIPLGMRAVAVRVNDIVGVAGFVSPGMRVDLLASGNPPNSSSNLGTQTQTVLQNIEVLSAGQNIQKDAEGKPVTVQVVNLLVTPEQAEKLSLASTDTKIQLVLRNPLDTETTKTPGTALAYILQGSAPVKPEPKPAAPKAKPRPPAPPTVEIITGSRKGSGPSQSSMRNLSK